MNNHEKSRPPKLSLRFLRFFLKEEYLEEVEGDMEEIFEDNLDQHSLRKARLLYLLDVLKLFRPSMIKGIHLSRYSAYAGMINSYFIIALRNLLKHKMYAYVNIGGLALGITCFVAITLFVSHELSYDRHFANAERVYRVYAHEQSGETYFGTDNYATIPIPLARAIKEEVPEVEHLTTFEPYSVLLSNERAGYNETGLWVDEQFFDVFSLKFVVGNPKKALLQPSSIVLTESLANKLFGEENPIGQEVTRQIRRDIETFTVTGIIEDAPENTSFKFSYVAPYKSHFYYEDAWNTSNAHTFMTLSASANPRNVEAKIPALLKKYQEVSLSTEFLNEEYLLKPLLGYHLENSVLDDIGLKGSRQQLRIFSVVAILVLLLACINYMNLAIARSVNRTKEVGVRKVIGASRGQLVRQFLAESVLIALLAMVGAVILLALLLPVFSNLVERPLSFNLLTNSFLLSGLLFLVLLVGLISGSYPALFVSSFKPIDSLKGQQGSRKTNFNWQKILVVGQYAVSICMIIGSLVIYSQYRFIQQQEVGYDKDQIIAVRINDFPSSDKYEVLRNELEKHTNIIRVTASNELPLNITSNTIVNYEENNTDDPLVMYRTRVEDHFLDVYGIELIAGYDPSDSSSANQVPSLFLNESACKSSGWTPEEALGQIIKHRGKVIGVVRDFHMLPLNFAIEPLMLQMNNRGNLRYLSIKVSADDIPGTIDILESTVRQYSNFPFDYEFLDEEFSQLYENDTRMGKTLAILTLISIIIASMGLFGLAVFSANKRVKEVGIRKILGASVNTLVGLLSKDFIKMVIIGCGLAIPAAWYFSSEWLSNYAYRISLQWWMFAVPALAVMVLAFFTISSQAMKAALNNPVNSLRDA
ncbi:MAG: ABC transporter permease [Bacteroidota bacterium]